MVVGPGRFEAMGKLFNGALALWSPNDKTNCRCADSANCPERFRHAVSFLLSDWATIRAFFRELDAGCRRGVVGRETFVGPSEEATLLVWIRYVSAGCWGLEHA